MYDGPVTQPPTTAPLLGEPLAVELMNTIWADRSGVHDALADEAGTLAWLRAVEPRLPRSPAVDRWLRDVSSTDPSTELSEATEGLRRLRDALRRVAATRTADPRPAAASA